MSKDEAYEASCSQVKGDKGTADKVASDVGASKWTHPGSEKQIKFALRSNIGRTFVPLVNESGSPPPDAASRSE